MAESVVCSQDDLRALTAEAKAQGAKEAMGGVKSTQATGYFSTVRFQGDRVGTSPGPFVTTIAAGDRVAFGYALNDNLQATNAGYSLLSAASPATLAETNLTDKTHTRDGESYFIKGIAFYLSDDSDGMLAKLIWSKAFVQLKMGSNLSFPLGKLAFFPALGGLHGWATTAQIAPPLDSGTTMVQSYGNGVEDEASFFHFPEESPMIWRPAGKTDSALSVTFTLPNDIALSALGRAEASGIEAWEPPVTNAPFSYVDITVRLIGKSLNNVSLNQ